MIHTYKATKADMVYILDQMLDYVRNCEEEDAGHYLSDIGGTGLFHDACGKPIQFKGDSITITSDY